MAYGRLSYKGPMPVGKTSGPMLGGAGTVKPATPAANPVVQQQQDIAMAKALGLPGAKGAKPQSVGRQNQKVKIAANPKSGGDMKAPEAKNAPVPKSRPNPARPAKPIAVSGRAGKSLRSQSKS